MNIDNMMPIQQSYAIQNHKFLPLIFLMLFIYKD